MRGEWDTSRMSKSNPSPALLLFVAGFAYWFWVLLPYYNIPSQDDGLNHLYFLDALRAGHTWALGHLNYRFASEFGPTRMAFYPAGMHAFLAWVLNIFSFGSDFFNLAFVLKAVAILCLSGTPVFIYQGLRRNEPSLGAWEAALISAAAATLLIFPAAPLGEGGLPRLCAQSLALPFAYFALSPRVSERSLFLVIAFVTPILFYVHPSSAFVLYPAILLGVSNLNLKPKNLPYLLLAFLVAGLGILIPMKTAQVDLAVAGISESGVHREHLPHLMFDRLTGIAHFIFDDAHGLGKFWSLRSLLGYLGIYSWLKKPGRRGWMLLYLTPFLISLSALAPGTILQAPGGIYYQSVKRIAEIALLPLTLSWAAGWILLFERIDSRHVKAVKTTLTLTMGLWIAVSGYRCMKTVREMADLFHTPTFVSVERLRRVLRDIPKGSVLTSQQPWFGISEVIRPDLLYVGTGECLGRRNPHCDRREKWMREARAAAEGMTPFLAPEFTGRKVFYLSETESAILVLPLR